MRHFIRLHRLPPNGNRVHIDVTLKDWARANQNLFPGYTFENSQNETPITHVIRDFLRRQGFELIEGGDNIVLTHENEELHRGEFI